MRMICLGMALINLAGSGVQFVYLQQPAMGMLGLAFTLGALGLWYAWRPT